MPATMLSGTAIFRSLGESRNASGARQSRKTIAIPRVAINESNVNVGTGISVKRARIALAFGL
jgi:hypothetical protein